ncbi:MAG: PIN/TRAM domain-containing protein [Planctomycetota bacterium]
MNESLETKVSISIMLLMILRVAYLLICAGAILAYISTETVAGEPALLPRVIENNKAISFFVLLLLSQAVTIIDLIIRRKRIDIISAIYFGILIGVLLAYLMIQALTPIVPVNTPYHTLVVLLTLLILPYLCVSLLLQTKDDFRFVIPYVEFQRDLKSGRPLVVDSSSLIDGRIADVVETNIIDSQLIVPDFVLAEVQDVADSSDKNRRTRGRRGLEVLAKLQQSTIVDVKVMETSRTDFKMMTVDQKVVALAKQVRGGVITNDFNLNKVASVQGIPVINLNDVSNALKPRYIPGERLSIKIIKEGEGPGQGVGYLDDGTMVVCENAANMTGKDANVVVTSVLQSSAGRMIFCKLVYKAGDTQA